MYVYIYSKKVRGRVVLHPVIVPKADMVKSHIAKQLLRRYCSKNGMTSDLKLFSVECLRFFQIPVYYIYILLFLYIIINIFTFLLTK